MPQVPTILSDSPLQGGFQTQRANADDSISRGMMQMSHGLGQAASVVADMANKRQELQDNRWVMESLSHARNAQSEFTSNPENNMSETFAGDFKTFADNEWKGYEKQAPSKEALVRLRGHYLSLSDGNYGSALDKTASTSLSNTISAVTKADVEIGQTYLKNRTGPGDANTKLVEAITLQMEMTKEQLAMAPHLADKLNNKMIQDLTLLTVDYSPALARKVLNMGSLDGGDRHTLETTIQRAEDAGNLGSQLAADDSIKNYVSAAQSGGPLEKFDHNIILSNYSREKAAHLVSIVDNAYDLSQSIKTHKAEVAGGNAQALDRKDVALQKNWQDNPKEAKKHQAVYEAMHQVLDAKKRDIVQDVVGYIKADNPVLKSLFSKAVVSKFPEDYTDYVNALLSFQREGPGKDLYHGLPRDKWSVLSREEAESIAESFKGSPNDILKNIQNLRGRYQDKQHFQLAINDLVKLPGNKGIPPAFNVVLLHLNDDGQPDQIAKDLIGAISKKDDILKWMPAGESQVDFDKAIDNELQVLQSILPADNFQRANLMTAYRDTVNLFAHTYKGMGAAKAVQQATYDLLHTKLFMKDGMIIPRERPPVDGRRQPSRTDVESEVLFNRLKLTKQLIDPLEVHLKNKDGSYQIPYTEQFGTPQKRAQYIRDQVTKYSKWHVSPGGESATLYIGDGKRSWEARDNKGRAFVVNLMDVERTDLFNEVFHGSAFGGMSGGVRTPKYLGISPHVKDSYDYNATHFPLDKSLINRQ